MYSSLISHEKVWRTALVPICETCICTQPHTLWHTLRVEQTGRAERLRLCHRGWVIIANCASGEAAQAVGREGAGWLQRGGSGKTSERGWQQMKAGNERKDRRSGAMEGGGAEQWNNESYDASVDFYTNWGKQCRSKTVTWCLKVHNISRFSLKAISFLDIPDAYWLESCVKYLFL